MKNKANFWLNLMIVLAFIYGGVAIASLVFIPIGIYSIYGAMYYSSCTKLTDSELYTQKNRLKNWAIYFSIFMFPLGLFSIVIAKIAGDNKVSVEPSGEPNYTFTETQVNEEVQKNYTNSETTQKVISEEDMEKFEQLKRYKEQGIITDAEFERAKKEIFE